MCRLLRYCISHSLYTAISKLEDLRNGVSMWSSIRFVGCLSTLNLILAILLGLYAHWEKTAEPVLLAVFILGLFVMGMASIVYYYFGMERFSLWVFHLWLGFLMGLLCFLNHPTIGADMKELVSIYMLIASMGIRTLGALAERICGYTRHCPALLTSAEVLELTGFAVATMMKVVNASISLIVLSLAVATLIVDLRMKSFLALPNLICFSVITALFFFNSLGVLTNPYALACFLSRLVCDPLLDIYFSGLSVTERWLPFLKRRGLWRRLTLLPLITVEMTFLILAGFKMGDLDRWYVMIPGFSFSGIFWIICHVVFLVTLWGFHSKLSDCQRVSALQMADPGALARVMASKGMRHFCLISKCLVLFSLMSTAILGAFLWQPSNSLFIGVFLLVLPLESLAYGLFYELGNCLGGTCVGYAVIIPTNYCSVDGPMLLPPDQVQELNRRCTGMLNSIQRFFSHHMIDVQGCDYSSSGVTRNTLYSKLRTFLEAHTADGPRYDTYLLFYSGHTHRTGEWALAGGDVLPLDEVIQLWREKNGAHCSRLVVVLDTENSLPWVKEVRKVGELYVAVQGAALSTSTDVELQDSPQLGDFTFQWVEFNCNPDSDLCWAERGRGLGADYGVSRHWANYKLHLPTGSDIAKHWRLYFPHWTYPVVQLAHWSVSLNVFWTCDMCLRVLRRLKLRWFPPAVLDTGQGFKLVRS